MNKITLSMIFLMILMAVVSSLTVEYVSPIDEFYLIKGGAVMGNITFETNATPTGASGAIQNMTLFTNISGTWLANFTNDTVGLVGTAVSTKFNTPSSNVTILSAGLSDGLVFVWNVYACDNVTKFGSEDVILDSDVYVVFDNYTNATGHGLCNATCKDAWIITAGRGQVLRYPIDTLDGVRNTTGEDISGHCTLNGSTDGFFRCNQTKTVYNGSGFLSTEAFITSTVKANYTIVDTCGYIGANRTVYVEDAPSITLNLPSDSSFDTDGTISINFSVTGDDDNYLCQVYSNDTGTWREDGGSNNAINNTDKLTSKVFSEKNGIVWNVRCSESTNSNIYGWSTSNYTITVDQTNPAITSSAPSYFTNISTAYSGYINLTVVDNNADSCDLYIDGTLDDTVSYTTNVPFAQYFNITEGEHNWSIICNDSSGRIDTVANTSITLDTITPGLNKNTNYTSEIANCEGFTVEFNFTEAVNATLTYGLTTMSPTFTEIETDYAANQTFTLTFNDSYNTDFYVNITICDIAGNCNTSLSEKTINSPIPLCTGWSLWSVYDMTINLSDYRAASGADFVYYWNNTGQSWIYSSAAGSLNEGYNVGIGDVVQLYESVNTTYFRNTSGSPSYYVNLTEGHAYFGLYHDYSFGNISYNIFLNDTGGNVTVTDLWGGGLEFIVDYYSGFNNSNQEYVDAPYKWLWNNETTLGKNHKSGIDTLWAFVDYNLSINFTPNGQVLGNWSGG